MAKPNPKSAKKEIKSTKPAVKAGPAKKAGKPAPKVLAKPAPKKAVADKKPHGKKPSKPPVVKGVVKSPAAKAVVLKKPAAGKPVPPPATKVEMKKPTTVKAVEAEEVKKGKPAKIVAVAGAAAPAAKAGGKTAPKKKGSGKKDEFEMEEDLVGEGDDFASDELSEYQAELESAEEEVEEKEVIIEEAPVVVAPTAIKDKGDDIILTDAEGRRYCRVKDCDQVATVDGYCRFHYLLLWKKIQVRKKILADGKLERYIEELTSRYPDKFLEVIRRDLRSEKDFVSAIQEMEIDESGADSDFEDESSNFIDEVRGATPEGISDEEEY